MIAEVPFATEVMKSAVDICEFWLSLEKSELFDNPSLKSNFILNDYKPQHYSNNRKQSESLCWSKTRNKQHICYDINPKRVSTRF